MISQSSEFEFSRRAGVRRNRNLNPYVATAGSLGPVSMTLLLVVIVGILALLYLTQITKTTVYGYQVDALNSEREELLTRNQELQVEASRLQAVARIESSPVTAGLTPETQASFVNTPN